MATSDSAPSTTVESAFSSLPEISNPESAPETVVAEEGTTGVEAKLAEPKPATDVTESQTESNGFLQSSESATSA